MLGFRLAFLEDELICGILARYRTLLRVEDSAPLLSMLLGMPALAGTVTMPVGIGRYSPDLAADITTFEELTEQHTAMPYYRALTSEDLSRTMLTELCGRAQSNGRKKLSSV